ncbi:MAG: DNA polymerase III subunit alpha [Cyclobacteriaceae bacterium]
MINVHSFFSFKYGLRSIDELVDWSIKNQYKVMALTDINSTAGCLDFVRQAQKQNLRPIIGIDFRNGAKQQFIGIAQNNTGFQELNTFLSAHLHENKTIPKRAEFFKNCFIIYPLHNLPNRRLKEYEFVAIKPHQVTRVPYIKSLPVDKIIACPTFTLPSVEDFDIHNVLRAIDLNTLISKLEPEDTGEEADIFLTKKAFADYYRAIPQAMENLKTVLQNSKIDFQFSPDAQPQNLKTWTTSEEEDYKKVKQLCIDGFAYRYGHAAQISIKKRVVMELQIIRKMGFLSYFLTSWDIVTYARSKGYFYIGRGSGANSVVAYILRITDVDPIELDLYFERFINLFRTNPPDFDIDFSSWDRDDVTQYIFNRYENAVLLATHSTFQHKAVIREVGKAFGLPASEIDNLQKNNRNPDSQAKLILSYGERLAGFPSHLSVHAGGIIISEKPIHYFTATSLPPKGFPITHFDMIVAEDVGLFKYDILGQRGLGKIKDALTIIEKNQPNRLKIDIHDIKLFKEDELVRINLKEANAIGCFYVESPAMRMLLTKLKAEDYLTLVAASSIIRPGVARSGMMREYILRYRVPQRRKEAHPVLYSIMPDTFGVMVYQEDVIKVAHYFAGLTLAEADVLRRGMSGKYRSRKEFQQVKDKFFENCNQKGYDDALSKDVWRQIESFAGYAFAKGHSASYAIESYQSMFLKSHYPLEFMVAVLNNGGGFYSKEFYIHEARLHGGKIELPCVNESNNEVTIQKKTIFLGLGLINELEQGTIKSLLHSRKQHGPFVSIDDFIKRISISLDQLSLLIRINAFRFTGENKKALLWRAHFLLGNTGKSQTKPSLFEPSVKKYKLPEMEQSPLEDIYDQIALLGFPISTPFDLLSQRPSRYINAQDFHLYIGKKIRTMGYLVTTKNTRTIKGENMYFGNFIDEKGAFIDSVHFPPVAKQYPFNGRGIYAMEGILIEEFDAISLEVSYMKRLNYKTIEI